jgi:hypothetical protein
MEIIEQSIVISLFCVGLRIASDEGMILEFIRKPYVFLTEQDAPTLLTKVLINVLKPVIGCITCMASVWSLVISYCFYRVDYSIIVVIFMSAALNTLLYKIYDL